MTREELIEAGIIRPARAQEDGTTPLRLPEGKRVLRVDEAGRGAAARTTKRWREAGCPIDELEYLRRFDPLHEAAEVAIRAAKRARRGRPT